ncbi:hypothetical protein H257_00457 [Aphanomyces astaci]|uniref:Uncharacterized protein n=1 Tax=Aphanomyces astaci TaxID=112090 RepID=W4HCT0_APHAT|nr:hypothetical protein H257_00457 [Aphanomyces astaci]ETV89074.1 hypothetical protein H257_00457 [Aphanomyces astaci]|eukprot:XP_009821474.1 hypothetical protein H257_00457 [Aphanomyces astaci]
MLLHSMVRKSTRRLVRISTGHRLRDSIDTNDNPGPKFSLIQPADSHRLTRHLSILQERKYTVTDDTIKDEDGAECDAQDNSSQPFEMASVAMACRRRNGALATSLGASKDQGVLPLMQVRTDLHGAQWNRALYRRALASVRQLNALGSLSLSKQPVPGGVDNNAPAPSPAEVSRQWFRDLQTKATAPPPLPTPGSYRHSKWHHVTYGSTIYLESCATRACLLLGGSGKSVSNSQRRHAADPGTLLRMVDFADPFRRGYIYDGDAMWLRLDQFNPLLPKKRDPVALYLNDVQFFLSWSVAADGSSGQTVCIASALEALVPSIAHYGYDTSMAECLGENHAVMHLAKWTIQVVPSAADNDLDDEKDELYVGDEYCHGRAGNEPPDVNRPICNYSVVHLRQDDRLLVADKATGVASMQHVRSTSPRHTKAAQWRLCVRDPMPPTHPTGPLHLAGSSAEKATVNLHQSHRRTTAYFSTKNDMATDQMETHLASRTHLAMIHNAQETHAVEYFAHKYKTTALASHT